jgi:uncharacterized protein (TIGR02145 family)
MKKRAKTRMFPLIIMGLFLLFLNSCQKNDDNESYDPAFKAPVLTTLTVSRITQTTVTCGGNITSDAGLTVIARGVCWSTRITPTTSDNKTTDGSGAGSFTSNLTGLSANTTYYVRAYATNSEGTGYGSAMSFTTLPASGNTETDIDGNVYQTVTIGTQMWMAENLKVSHYLNGDAIPNVVADAAWSDLTTGAYCELNNIPANDSIYGKLYNFYAVADSRNICPSGWHVPSDSDWTILGNYLGNGAGGKLKEPGTIHWQSPNTGATNESRFTALGGGDRHDDASFWDLGIYGNWWSSTENNYTRAGGAWYRDIYFNSTDLERKSYSKGAGFSVRCIKN